MIVWLFPTIVFAKITTIPPPSDAVDGLPVVTKPAPPAPPINIRSSERCCAKDTPPKPPAFSPLALHHRFPPSPPTPKFDPPPPPVSPEIPEPAPLARGALPLLVFKSSFTIPKPFVKDCVAVLLKTYAVVGSMLQLSGVPLIDI